MTTAGLSEVASAPRFEGKLQTISAHGGLIHDLTKRSSIAQELDGRRQMAETLLVVGFVVIVLVRAVWERLEAGPERDRDELSDDGC